MSKRYEFMALIKENWDSINELKKLTLDNYSKAKQLQNISEKRKNIELALRIEEDISDYLDALRFISGHPTPTTLDRISNSSSPTRSSKDIPF